MHQDLSHQGGGSLNSELKSVPTFPCPPCRVTCGEKEGPQDHCSVERCHEKAFTGTTEWPRGPSAHGQKARSLVLGSDRWMEPRCGQCVNPQQSPEHKTPGVAGDGSVQVTP